MVNDKVPKINTRIIVLPIIQLRQGTNTRSVTDTACIRISSAVMDIY